MKSVCSVFTCSVLGVRAFMFWKCCRSSGCTDEAAVLKQVGRGEYGLR
jgi:hypothetical protein